MIANFSVQNFRSIKDKITLSFEADKSNDLEDYYVIEPKEGVRLLKLGMIYGANASGKTNLLEALDFLRILIIKPLAQKTDTLGFIPFRFDEKTLTENTIMELEFYQNGIKYFYMVEFEDMAVVKEELYFFNPKKALVYERNTSYEKQLVDVIFGNKIKINKEFKVILEANTLWNNTVLGGFLKTNFESKELTEVTSWFRHTLKSIITPRMELFQYVSNQLESNNINKETILEVLQKADFNISDFDVEVNEQEITPEFIEMVSKKFPMSNEEVSKLKREKKITTKELFFIHTIEGKGEFPLSYDDESAGTQRYYGFGGLLDLLVNKQTVFLIDEFESSLHPDLLKHFLLSFLVNSKQSQLITTTHLRELLMEQDIFRKDVIWFTEKKEDGSTDLYSLDDFDTSVIRKNSSIYNAYKAGKLGATPNLSDYYLNINYGAE